MDNLPSEILRRIFWKQSKEFLDSVRLTCGRFRVVVDASSPAIYADRCAIIRIDGRSSDKVNVTLLKNDHEGDSCEYKLVFDNHRLASISYISSSKTREDRSETDSMIGRKMEECLRLCRRVATDLVIKISGTLSQGLLDHLKSTLLQVNGLVLSCSLDEDICKKDIRDLLLAKRTLNIVGRYTGWNTFMNDNFYRCAAHEDFHVRIEDLEFKNEQLLILAQRSDLKNIVIGKANKITSIGVRNLVQNLLLSANREKKIITLVESVHPQGLIVPDSPVLIELRGAKVDQEISFDGVQRWIDYNYGNRLIRVKIVTSDEPDCCMTEITLMK